MVGHLHFEVRNGTTPVNPDAILPGARGSGARPARIKELPAWKAGWSIGIALVLALVLAPLTASADGHPGPEEQARELALAFRKAVLAGDRTAIVALIHPKGIRCGDTIYSKRVLARLAGTPGSWFHAVLFDTRELEGQGGRLEPVALKDFFERATDLTVSIGFAEYPGKRKHESPCIAYKTSKFVLTPGFCVSKWKGRWYMADFFDCP